MTPYKQLIRHDPANQQYGDCARTAIGCLLDRPPDTVPHFLEDGCKDGAEMHRRVNEWLKPLGLVYVQIPFDADVEQVMQSMHAINGDAFYLMGCGSPLADHVVVCRGDKIAWDPAGHEPWSIKRGSDGLVWVMLLCARSCAE